MKNAYTHPEAKDIIQQINIEQINAVAQQALHPQQLQIIVVANASSLKQQIQVLALPLVTLALTE